MWAEEISVRAGDLPEFLRYFNDADTPQQSWVSGSWDFSCHILKPALARQLGEPFDKVALEIGYGGGRLLHAACRHFRHVIGVDVHGQAAMVRTLLEQQGVSNFELHQTDGRSFPVASGSVDLVYSFIVLQHLPSMDALERNLQETRRVLRSEGAAILYFGYLPSRPWRWHGVRDLAAHQPARTREVTLRLTMPSARRLLGRAGFRTLQMRRSTKRPWREDYGGQFYAVLGLQASGRG